MITYRATLPIPDALFHRVVRLLRRYRAWHDQRPWQRAASCRAQAVLYLRVMQSGTRVEDAARDAGIGHSTGYTYFHEADAVIAAQAPDIPEVIKQAKDAGWTHLNLDGTLIPTDRVKVKGPSGYDSWYSGKHKRHGGNV